MKHERMIYKDLDAKIDKSDQTKQLTDAGIAERMFNNLKKRLEEERGDILDFGITACTFWVAVPYDGFLKGRGHQQIEAPVDVAMEWPQPEGGSRIMRWKVDEDSFGSSGEPLTSSQYELIQKLAEEVKASRKG